MERINCSTSVCAALSTPWFNTCSNKNQRYYRPLPVGSLLEPVPQAFYPAKYWPPAIPQANLQNVRALRLYAATGESARKWIIDPADNPGANAQNR